MNPPPPTLSVVIPVFNVEAFIEECLDSLLKQDFADWEAVVVDDHGDDASMDHVRRVAETDARIRIIDHGMNRGLGAARNTGVEHARGGYVLFLDSDDTFTEGTLAAVAAELSKRPVDILIFDHVRQYPSGRRKHSKNRQRFRDAPQQFTAATFPEVLNALAIAPGKAFSRDALARVDIDFPSGSYEDIPWTFVMLAVARHISWLDHLGYVYRQRPIGSILNTSSRKHFDIHAQYRLLFARLDRPDVAKLVVDRIYSTVSRHLWLVASPVTDRIADADRPDFIRASRGTLWAIRPSFGSWLREWKQPRHAALATGSVIAYRSVRAVIKRRRKVLKALAARGKTHSLS